MRHETSQSIAAINMTKVGKKGKKKRVQETNIILEKQEGEKG